MSPTLARSQWHDTLLPFVEAGHGEARRAHDEEKQFDAKVQKRFCRQCNEANSIIRSQLISLWSIDGSSEGWHLHQSSFSLLNHYRWCARGVNLLISPMSIESFFILRGEIEKKIEKNKNHCMKVCIYLCMIEAAVLISVCISRMKSSPTFDFRTVPNAHSCHYAARWLCAACARVPEPRRAVNRISQYKSLLLHYLIMASHGVSCPVLVVIILVCFWN